jgi:hypothetical protein
MAATSHQGESANSPSSGFNTNSVVVSYTHVVTESIARVAVSVQSLMWLASVRPRSDSGKTYHLSWL